ncbi:hypothetical protein P7D22_04685 [Lichenihabitans sp. Uapishka_5]|uniref:hypothetical protein n=1 Tax=Lichenihabitans sp. Uapishka_5 TaxID=3037302 RepID=UPI0029E81037|nr:hypothetical protein [Lichenihabitans sp. Uapishka_5]MDX7950475.1 hypothetical protein [Lichenihabitans sp. Uapishka_5]
MTAYTHFVTGYQVPEQTAQAHPIARKSKLEPRRVTVRKTPEEMTDDVLRRYPRVMARLAE